MHEGVTFLVSSRRSNHASKQRAVFQFPRLASEVFLNDGTQ